MIVYHGSTLVVDEPRILQSESCSPTRLYAYLEDEQTKVWHYSVDKIFDLYKTETETGKLELPEY